MYLTFIGWEAWVEIGPSLQLFYEVDNSVKATMVGVPYLTITINRRNTE
jgi:hypothetical protein